MKAKNIQYERVQGGVNAKVFFCSPSERGISRIMSDISSVCSRVDWVARSVVANVSILVSYRREITGFPENILTVGFPKRSVPVGICHHSFDPIPIICQRIEGYRGREESFSISHSSHPSVRTIAVIGELFQPEA